MMGHFFFLLGVVFLGSHEDFVAVAFIQAPHKQRGSRADARRRLRVVAGSGPDIVELVDAKFANPSDARMLRASGYRQLAAFRPATRVGEDHLGLVAVGEEASWRKLCHTLQLDGSGDVPSWGDHILVYYSAESLDQLSTQTLDEVRGMRDNLQRHYPDAKVVGFSFLYEPPHVDLLGKNPSSSSSSLAGGAESTTWASWGGGAPPLIASYHRESWGLLPNVENIKENDTNTLDKQQDPPASSYVAS